MKETMFYMNNPCTVVRSHGEECTEVIVYPEFAESIEGEQWCQACMLGSMDGANPSHNCSEYQEVIDAINDTQTSMPIIVENRLLHDKPLEFAEWKKIKEQTKRARKHNEGVVNIYVSMRGKIKALEDREFELKKEIEQQAKNLAIADSEIAKQESILSNLRSKTGDLQDSVSVGAVTLSLNSGELRELIKALVILDALKSAKLDKSFEWGDALPDDVDSEVDDYISGLTVQNIGGEK